MQIDAFSPGRAEAIVAGTLCLMSCFAQARSSHHAQRIAHNLAALAEDAGVTPELRTLCRRLSERWDAIALDAEMKDQAPATLVAHMH